MSLPTPSDLDAAGLSEIDALLSLGGLRRGAHKKIASARHAAMNASPGRKTPNVRPSRQSAAAQRPTILRIPQWQQYDWLIHGFSTRSGGVSTVYGPGKKCGELNLGLTSADTPENVQRNRELFLHALLASPSRARSKPSPLQWRFLRQIHSGLIVDPGLTDRFARLDGLDPLEQRPQPVPARTLVPPPEAPPQADGAIETRPGFLLGIQTADCVPILLADVKQRIVAAFHAGWRGTLARIVERGVGRMRAEYGSLPGHLTAAIGPAIGRCCYSVGEEVRMEFTSQFAYAEELFEEVFDLDPIKQKYPMLFLTARAPGHSNLGPSIHLDLAEANRRQLLDAGLDPRNIHALRLCTACDTTRFFSHRGDHGFTGRMLSAIGVHPAPSLSR